MTEQNRSALQTAPYDFDQTIVGQSLTDRKPRKKLSKFATALSSASLIFASCSSSPAKDSQSPSSDPTSGDFGDTTGGEIVPANLILPFNNTWYFTGGPHFDGLSNGKRYAVDFAASEIVKCPGGQPLTNETVIASESGKVTIVGDEKNPRDPNHSVVEIEDAQGFTLGYMHLANIDVKVGQNVKAGDSLGNPSCEIPPGGATSGIHLHQYLEKNGKALPIAGTIFSGWKVGETPGNYQGTMIKGGQIRTADTRRCDTESQCGGIVNALNTSTGNVESPTPTEQQKKPLVESVKEIALLDWLGPLWREQTFSKDFWSSFMKAEVNRDEFQNWQDKEQSKILNNGKSDIPLKITWLAGEIFKNPDNPNEAVAKYKHTGEIEINNISIISQESPFALSDAEKANGLEWHGMVQIKLIERYRALLFDTPTGPSLVWPKLSEAEKWAHTPAKEELPGFSVWREDDLNFEYFVRNGQWELAGNPMQISGDSEGAFRGLQVPFYYLKGANCAYQDAKTECRVIVVNPPYSK